MLLFKGAVLIRVATGIGSCGRLAHIAALTNHHTLGILGKSKKGVCRAQNTRRQNTVFIRETGKFCGWVMLPLRHRCRRVQG